MQRSPSRFAAWLGLSAILLLFIAPVISKSLEQTPARHAAMMMTMTGMAMDDMPMMEMTPAEHARMLQHHPVSMMEDSACGYCVLLAHLPLDLTSLPPLWSSLQAAKPPNLPLFRPAVARFIPRFFHPRAPPAY
ncbi:DUF2946 domain-containing protein [Pantoea sp. BAV 3049]|uniref:DUF2946 domain-containing protein n=1 Tax=Pantoea sp. BAV 3049 TaxID=2654188 RepID=UPI00131D70B9|nr:DUF2946 domain-containing protein [Pantoea sp. BAV 3049]